MRYISEAEAEQIELEKIEELDYCYKIITEKYGSLKEAFKQAAKDGEETRLLYNVLEELRPFVEFILNDDDQTLIEYLEKYTFAELLQLQQDPESDFYKVMEEARQAKENAARVTVRHTKNIEFPLDKINNNAWNQLTEDTDGQLKIVFKMLPKQSPEIKAVYSIDFNSLGGNLKITKSLTPFDKRVYIAVSALFNAGNNVITLSQIYTTMGNTGKPSAAQLKKINNSINKMLGARITLDNASEAEATKGKIPHYQYSGSLLPIETITAIINGQITKGAINIFREPPLMTFAKGRQQITTINVSLLQSPISKTDANLSIDDYLIDRISKAKNKNHSSCRILYKTLYEHANITEKKQKQRAPEKIETYLTYYKKQGFIKYFTTQADGVRVYL